jgi:hypothetical protein
MAKGLLILFGVLVGFGTTRKGFAIKVDWFPLFNFCACFSAITREFRLHKFSHVLFGFG